MQKDCVVRKSNPFQKKVWVRKERYTPPETIFNQIIQELGGEVKGEVELSRSTETQREEA